MKKLLDNLHYLFFIREQAAVADEGDKENSIKSNSQQMIHERRQYCSAMNGIWSNFYLKWDKITYERGGRHFRPYKETEEPKK